MEKNYQAWTLLKRVLHNTDDPRLFFHEREIWYCHLGENKNIGFEQDGSDDQFLRPVVVIRKFNNDIFWGVPLTRTQKDLPFYFTFIIQSEVGTNEEKSTAVLSQIRLIDAKRLRRMIGYISKKDAALLKKKLMALLP